MTNPSEQSPHYRSLIRKMFFTIIAVSFIPVFLVSATIFYQFRTSYREKIFAHLNEMVQKHTTNIDIFLMNKLSDIRYLSRSAGFNNLSNEVFLQKTMTIMQQEYGSVFVDIGVIDDMGKQVAYAGPYHLANADYADADWFQITMTRQHFISDVFLGLRGVPHFIIAVRNTRDGKPWILRATIDFEAFNSMVAKIRVGETGFAFIINQEGSFQTNPIFNVIPNKDLYISVFQQEKALEKQYAVHIREEVDGSGKKNIYMGSLLKNGDWLLIYQQDSADAFSKLNQTQFFSMIIFILGGIGIVIMAFVLSGRMVKHIATTDSEKEMLNQQVIETGKLASIGELAAGIAHEINNPVAIMVEEAGWIQDLLEEEEFQASENYDEFKRALAQIKTQGTRCKDINYKLLSFARKTDSRIQDIQVNDLIMDLISLSDQRGKYSMVEIHSQPAEHLPLLRLSVSELQQVFLNLINNAIDAMEKKGGKLTISTRQEDRLVVVEMADTGAGIPEANLSRIFDPFFTTKPVGKGTGLGLAICYGIVKKMGGEIKVRSTLNVGTTFTVYLPISEETLTPDTVIV
ncbi:MAG: ATP-binding protein [Desulfatirhabdiaceae bacterium]|jgi:two-component system NtrC family sensor kinase|nr:ATP-binding protein [Desulfatirhabdiaceae bacterium]